MKKTIKDLLFDSNKGKIKLNERASIFFFCLLLSTFFWFLSSLSKNYTTTLSIPLSYTSYNKKTILTNTPIDRIEVRVKGNGFDLLGEQMSLNRKMIEVDLSKLQLNKKGRQGISTQFLRPFILEHLDKSLNFESIIIDSLVFITQPRIAKQLTVIPKLDLTFKSSYNLKGNVEVLPQSVTVSGPKDRIDSLAFIKIEELVEEDLSSSKTIVYNLKENKKYRGLKIEPAEVELVIPVEKFTEKVFDLQLKLDDKGFGNTKEVVTFPNHVKVALLVPLSNYELLSERDIVASVKLKKNISEKKKLEVSLEGIPSYAKLLRVEPNKVEFIIKK